MKVIAIDPGVMTGYCYATIEDGKLTYYPFQTVDDVDGLWERLAMFQPRYIVMEDFEVRRGNLAKGGLNLFPVQLIGVARLYAEWTGIQHPVAISLQKAAQGKGYYTNPVLRSVGLYRQKLQHGMDASRHLLQWCMFGSGNQFIGSQRHDEFATISEEMEWWRGA